MVIIIIGSLAGQMQWTSLFVHFLKVLEDNRNRG